MMIEVQNVELLPFLGEVFGLGAKHLALRCATPSQFLPFLWEVIGLGAKHLALRFTAPSQGTMRLRSRCATLSTSLS